MGENTANEHPVDVIPVYFVPDESASTAPVVSDLNRGLTSVVTALHEEPGAAAMVRFSVVGSA